MPASRVKKLASLRSSSVTGQPRASPGAHGPCTRSSKASASDLSCAAWLREVFRCSIAWLSDAPSTRRRAGSPLRRKSRFLPLAHTTRRAFHPQDSSERFQNGSLHHIHLPQALLGAITSTVVRAGPTHAGSCSGEPPHVRRYRCRRSDASRRVVGEGKVNYSPAAVPNRSANRRRRRWCRSPTTAARGDGSG
jgi:hypothetical protein